MDLQSQYAVCSKMKSNIYFSRQFLFVEALTFYLNRSYEVDCCTALETDK